MARYKVIKPTFENPLLKRAKKRDRIRNAVLTAWGVLMIAAICAMGLHEGNGLVTGWGLIVMGLVVVCPRPFSCYTPSAKDGKCWAP